MTRARPGAVRSPVCSARSPRTPTSSTSTRGGTSRSCTGSIRAAGEASLCERLARRRDRAPRRARAAALRAPAGAAPRRARRARALVDRRRARAAPALRRLPPLDLHGPADDARRALARRWARLRPAGSPVVSAHEIAVVLARDVVRQAFVNGFYGLSLVVLFLVFQAPDVALSAITVGSAAAPLVIAISIARVHRRERKR